MSWNEIDKRKIDLYTWITTYQIIYWFSSRKKRRHNFNDTIVALSYLWKKGDSLDTTVKQGHIQENDEEGERKKRTLADWAEIRALCTDPAD